MTETGAIGRQSPYPVQGGGSAPKPGDNSMKQFGNASTVRKILIWLVVLAKTLYIVWFYSFGVGLNLGDTASYIDEANAAAYLERSGGIGFAYVATLIYSNPVLRLVVEATTIAVICKLLLKVKTDSQAVVVTCLLLLPTSLAFMTVASKELLVFLLLCVIYRMGAWFGLPAFVVTVALKPSFGVIAILPVIRRLSFVPLYFLLVAVLAAVLLSLRKWIELYQSFFRENAAHFKAGNLTYADPGFFPISPFLRVVGLDLGGMELYGVAIGLMVLAVNLLVLYVLTSRYGAFNGSMMFIVFAVAVLPYSVHNLGSAARYQAPLACALVLNELLVNARHNRSLGVKWRN